VTGLAPRIFLSTALVIVVVLGGALALTKYRADKTADQSIEKALTATQSAIEDVLTARSQGLLQVTAGLAQVPDYVARIASALETESRSNLLDQVDEYATQTGAAWALLTDAHGVLQAWTYERSYFGDDLSESSLVGLALAGDTTKGVWIEPSSEGDIIFQAVAVPVFDPSRSAIHGILVTAYQINHELAEEIKRHTNSDVVFFALDSIGLAQVVVSTLDAESLSGTLRGLDLESAVDSDSVGTRLHLNVAGEVIMGTAGPLPTASGYAVGGYLGLRSRSVELAAFTQLGRTILWVFAGGLALALLSTFLVARKITRPLTQLVGATQQVGEGQYSGTIEVRSRDEIGALADAFRDMMRELKAKEELVAYLSTQEQETLVMPATPVPSTGEKPTSPFASQHSTRISIGTNLLGRYEISEVLGRGGMGVVYRAFDRELEEEVAIKTIRPEAVVADASLRERFKQEIRLARKISHKNVVRTHDLGEVDGTYYVTMEYVDGKNLKELIHQRGTLPASVTLTVGKQLCRALEVAHEEGVIHRDIKPHNMVLDARGFLKVMDFGIACLAEVPDAPERRERLTEVGAAVGTPEYMAPEQLLGQPIDARADIYAAGAVLFECLTGRVVFDAPTLPALMAKHIEEDADDPRTLNPDVPEELAELVLKALAKEADDRFASASELYQALDAIRLN
jgi:serine/threonine-protein kinase